ncbi:MAG: AzlD domain-containing protein, partial [Mesorhizobium sp.]
MSYFSSSAWWWPYMFILVAGFAATDIWRFLGVYLGGKLSEDSDLLVLVRT